MRAIREDAQGDQPSSLKVAQGDHHEHLKALKQTDPQHDCVMCIIENRRFNRPELLLAVYIRECTYQILLESPQDINSPFGSYTNPPFSLSLSLSISPAIPPAYMKYPQCRVHLYALP